MNSEAFFKLTYGLYVVSSLHQGKKNGFIANSVFQVTSEPAQIAVVCHKNNFTSAMITESKVFSVSVLEKDVQPKLIGLFGYKSGNKEDKFAKTGHIEGKTGVPIVVEDTVAWFECELVQAFDVGTHTIFIGQIIENALLADDKIPLTYAYYRDIKKGKAPANAPTYIKPS